MSEEKYRGAIPEKLKLDEKKQYIINLPNGEQITIELNDREIYTVENWIQLFGKHNIRFDIWNILQIYEEANVTEISSMVEQSKSTVARHLNSMEEDGLILSRIPEKAQKGKIPPKLFKINRKLFQIWENNPVNKEPPEDPSELIEFYKKNIQMYRATIHRFKRLLDSVLPLLDEFEESLDDIGAAKEIFNTYFNFTRLEPWFAYCYVNDKYYDEALDYFNEFMKKGQVLLAKQNNDSEVKERDYTCIHAIFPIKALMEIYRRRLKEK